MKMSEKTLLKKIEQAFAENYCNGSYKVECEHEYDDVTYYVLFYTYKTGETIAVDIDVTFLGEVKFYSPVHSYYISNFNYHTKSVINVLRMLFDMIDSNKDAIVNYYKIKTEETEETTEKEDCKTVKEKEQYFDTDSLQPNKKIIAKIESINHCPNQNTCCIVSPFVHCNYNYKSDSCIKAHKNFIHDCEQVHKQMKARSNPEWHHVSLRTLANIDNDMLDKKRRLYMRVYRMTVNVVNTIYKCNRLSSIDKLRTNLIQTVRNMAKNGAIEWALVYYVKAKIDNCYLVKGLQSSFYSVTYNNKKSRSYTKTFYI
jgi:hypothetical protein